MIARNKNHKFVFSTQGDFLAFLESHPPQCENPSSHYGSDSFCFESYDLAMEHCKNGWNFGEDKAHDLAGRLFDSISAHMALTDVYYDVTGECFDIGRVLTGEPESWLNLRHE